MESTIKTQQTVSTSTQHKRTSRHPSEQTKQRISSSLKQRWQNQGGFNDTHREHLSASLRNYWQNDSNFPADGARHEGTGRGYIETGDVV